MLIYVHRTKIPSARLTVDYDKRWDMWDKAYGMFFLLALCHHNSFPPFLSPLISPLHSPRLAYSPLFRDEGSESHSPWREYYFADVP
jgi:hypothetical protein